VQAGATAHVVNRRGIGYRLVHRVPGADREPDNRQAFGRGALIELVGRLDEGLGLRVARHSPARGGRKASDLDV
jgi:hypothetical protein